MLPTSSSRAGTLPRALSWLIVLALAAAGPSSVVAKKDPPAVVVPPMPAIETVSPVYVSRLTGMGAAWTDRQSSSDACRVRRSL